MTVTVADSFVDEDLATNLKNAEEITYEMNRVYQALYAAGLDPELLNKMQLSQVVRALLTDSTFAEQKGAFSAFLRLNGISDIAHYTAEEKMRDMPETQQAVVEGEDAEKDWELRRLNLASFLVTMNELYSDGAERQVITAEIEAFNKATPPTMASGVVDTSYHDNRPIPVNMLPMSQVVGKMLSAKLQGVVDDLRDRVRPLKVENMEESWVGKAARTPQITPGNRNVVSHSMAM